MSTLVADRHSTATSAGCRPLAVVHLLASRALAGKERQLLQILARDGNTVTSHVLLFSEGGHHRALTSALSSAGCRFDVLPYDTPRLRRAAGDVAQRLARMNADVLCAHDYKSNLVGLWAARRTDVSLVSVFHGHTAESRKVRLYEALDRRVLRRVDQCVCVAQASADRVIATGVPATRVTVVRNAVELDDRWADRESSRAKLAQFWARAPRLVIGAAGRLSHEKGFDLLIEAARNVVARFDAGFLVFGEGPQRADLERRIAAVGLQNHFVLGGQRNDLHALLPGLDVLAVPSRTEGLPTIVLEGMAAGVPIVATTVGGIPETLEGDCGRLVPPERSDLLSDALLELLDDPERAAGLRRRARESVVLRFSAERQAREHYELYARVAGRRSR